jgi:hypothetical protein
VSERLREEVWKSLSWHERLRLHLRGVQATEAWLTEAALERRVAELEKALREAERVVRIYADLGGDAALEYFAEVRPRSPEREE